ncbi:unnamed protein product [Moneuplotes crassus]|uniref:Peptidase M20 dimerisation domain-containing protein n=1 Tax=Euplotes crassus TaxID=5936 RepID=A0AAD1XBW8_EUPCR|nr:unnamed protein product [Moneuplotes crassus]
MDIDKTNEFLEANFESKFVDSLKDFIRIPNLSPAFDSEFLTNGLIDEAIEYVQKFAEDLQIEGLQSHLVKNEQGNPMLIFVYEGTAAANILVYGHLDKQPHMEGWQEGTGPTNPVVIDGHLYGRGSADDGYVPFATLLALKNALDQGQPLPRIVLVLETEEESGSPHVVSLLELSSEYIKDPDYCICMANTAFDFDSLWLTSTMRGILAFNLKVSVTEIACHSGVCGGAIPESFRIANSLIDRVEDSSTKRIPLFEVEIPESYVEEAKHVSSLEGEDSFKDFNFLDGVTPIKVDPAESYLNIRWRPSLAVTGADGLPPTSKAGNVVRDSTTLKLCFRLPPGVSSTESFEKVKEIFTKDVPYDAKVEISGLQTGDGWRMKELDAKFRDLLNDVSDTFFSKKVGSFGGGGSIPFLKTLENRYTKAKIIGVGSKGPGHNIHAPNENLYLPYTKKFIGAFSHILAGLV